jgi:hypothetical protein
MRVEKNLAPFCRHPGVVRPFEFIAQRTIYIKTNLLGPVFNFKVNDRSRRV